MSTPYLNSCPKVGCNRKNDCHPFRKIVIPAVLGDDSEDSEVAPENGAYCNAIVEYEANGAVYFYSSDGIPTKLINSDVEVNDATLTIKQGDTTLGTFTANASQDVEVNIPESSGGSKVYTIIIPDNIWDGRYDTSYGEGTGALVLTLSEKIETSPIVIFDENDDYVTPAEIESLSAGNLDITFKLDVPYMDHISAGPQSYWDVPAFNGYFKMDSFAPATEEKPWYMMGRCYDHDGGQYLISIKTYEEDDDVSYDSTIYIPNAYSSQKLTNKEIK